MSESPPEPRTLKSARALLALPLAPVARAVRLLGEKVLEATEKRPGRRPQDEECATEPPRLQGATQKNPLNQS